jgi:TatD DNase family protein
MSEPRADASGSPSFPNLPRLPAGVSVIDSHCHLDEERFAVDRELVIERALAAGVSAMVTIGAGGPLRCNDEAVALAARHEPVFATVGIHPHEARLASDELFAELEHLARRPKVVAIGETGLDFYYDNSPRSDQEQAFRRSIALARRLGLPLSVHVRNAYDVTARIVREERGDEIGGIIHCFSGGPAEARTFLDLGFHLSFSGIVTFKKAGELREAARLVPHDRLLIETDAPFLAPAPHRGRRNEPALVLFTALHLADLLGIAIEDLARATRDSTIRAYRLPLDR